MKKLDKLLTLYGSNKSRKCAVVMNNICSAATNMYAKYILEGVFHNNGPTSIIYSCWFNHDTPSHLQDSMKIKIFKTDGKKVLNKDIISFGEWVDLLQDNTFVSMTLTKILTGEEKECINYRVIKV